MGKPPRVAIPCKRIATRRTTTASSPGPGPATRTTSSPSRRVERESAGHASHAAHTTHAPHTTHAATGSVVMVVVVMRTAPGSVTAHHVDDEFRVDLHAAATGTAAHAAEDVGHASHAARLREHVGRVEQVFARVVPAAFAGLPCVGTTGQRRRKGWTKGQEGRPGRQDTWVIRV